MAQPTPYDRQFSFQDFQAQEPTTPLPGDEVDGELNSVKVTLDQTLVNLAKIQRDDGALKNGIVTQDSLSDSLSIGFTYRGSWVSGVNYLISDGASVGSTFYKARSSHLSSGLNQPPNAAFWDPIADFTPLAIGVDSIFTAAIQDGAVTEPKHATGGVSTRALANASVTTAKIADGNVTEAKHATGGVSTRALADGAATNAKLANVPTLTLKGRATAGTGVPEDLTAAQVQQILGSNVLGQCELVRTSSSLLTLNRNRGGRLFINGVLELIPATAPTLDVSGATPDTLYFIYAYMNTGVMTLERSTTAPTADTTYGHQIKTGDTTRTLVGMARPATGPVWQDSAALRLVRSWFNSPTITASNAFTAQRARTNTSWGEIDSEIRIGFLIWSHEAVHASVNGYMFNSGAAQTLASVGYDSSTANEGSSSNFGTSGGTIGYSRAKSGLSTGYHDVRVLGRTSSGTGTYSTTTPEFTTLDLVIR